jgi:prophage regulatory protein
MTNQILKLPAVMQLTALSRSSLYALAKLGKFPAPIKLSERAVGWSAAEVNAWLAERAAQRAGGVK